jgi:N6-adenosine-specific RNA methylase IME4
MVRFKTILADPPWEYKLWSPKGNRAEAHYPTQDSNWIERLPVNEVADKNCTLLLWAVNPRLPDAFKVVEAWGFEFKSMMTWVKMSRAACPRIGLGYHARACTEQLIIATKGKPSAPPVDKRPMGALFHPIGKHSAKPECQYDLAENYAGPYLEMFHRPRNGMFPPRDGWVFTGNEVDGLDMGEALRRLRDA